MCKQFMTISFSTIEHESHTENTAEGEREGGKREGAMGRERETLKVHNKFLRLLF